MPSIVRRPSGVRTQARTCPPIPLYLLDLGGQQHLDAFCLQNALNLVRDIRVFAFGQPRTMIDDGDATAEAPVRLGKFEADISAAKNDQMTRNPVEFERLDIA